MTDSLAYRVVKKLHLSVVFLIFGLVASPAMVLAQDASQLTKERCTWLDGYIDTLRQSDLSSRLNRGRDYDNISKQTDAFAQRLRNNHIDTGIFDDLSRQFTDQVSQFRDSYAHYDDSLIALATVDCKNHPDEFIAKLEQARSKRSEIAARVSQIDGILQQYREKATVLQTQLQPAPASQATQ